MGAGADGGTCVVSCMDRVAPGVGGGSAGSGGNGGASAGVPGAFAVCSITVGFASGAGVVVEREATVGRGAGAASSGRYRTVPTRTGAGVASFAAGVVLSAGALATTWKGIRTTAPRANSAPFSHRRGCVGTTSTCSSMRSLLCSA
ncbi:hypothetical protein COEX109129_41075 [Corallococcus exiguus]